MEQLVSKALSRIHRVRRIARQLHNHRLRPGLTPPISRGLVSRKQEHQVARQPSISPDVRLRAGDAIKKIRDLAVWKPPDAACHDEQSLFGSCTAKISAGKHSLSQFAECRGKVLSAVIYAEAIHEAPVGWKSFPADDAANALVAGSLGYRPALLCQKIEMRRFSLWLRCLLRSVGERELNLEGIGANKISKNLRVGAYREYRQHEEEQNRQADDTRCGGVWSHSWSWSQRC
jgi:hypothetical protein